MHVHRDFSVLSPFIFCMVELVFSRQNSYEGCFIETLPRQYVLVSSFLTLNILILFWCFHYWLWTSKCYTVQKWSFSLRKSSENVTKEAADLAKFTEEIVNEKFHFLWSADWVLVFHETWSSRKFLWTKFFSLCKDRPKVFRKLDHFQGYQ